MGSALGGVIGAAFFLWIAGTRALDPAEIGWLMRFDWRIHFLGWHFFRFEPWQWPPGLIGSYFAPIGTSIGFTDSVPLVALVLKPFSGWLPSTFQYIGLWLLLCFTLQGAFGAWLISRWTPRVLAQATGAALFAMAPILLIRIGHPSLCAQWLLLWVLVIAGREGERRFRAVEWAVVGLLAGLLHPYLVAMTGAMLVAVAAAPSLVPVRHRLTALAGCAVTVLAGWWTSGMFSVSGAESMATEGLGHYSMNLLAPVNPVGWSLFLPDLPVATTGQSFEGMAYPGLGVLLLIAGAAVLWAGARWRRSPGRGSMGYPWLLVLVAVAMAVFALSPRITAGSAVLIDLSGPWTMALSVFRSTGRFIWPLTYLAMAWAVGTVVLRLPPRAALTVLLTVFIVQALDLHGAHEERRRGARDPGFYAWDDPMAAPHWRQILEGYAHVVLYPPSECGTAPMPFEPAAYHAGLQGLSINTGGVARPDMAARIAYCHDLGEQVKAGRLEDDSLYIVVPSEIEAIRLAASPPAVCGFVDTVPVCVTAASYQRWRAWAALE